MASTLKLRKPKTRQIHARVPLPLSAHAFGVANAEYDGSLSDYVRDLIKADKARREAAALGQPAQVAA